MKGIGWILDIYVSKASAVLWFKLETGKTIRLTDTYHPIFYIELREDYRPEEMTETLSLHPLILGAQVEERYTSILNREKSKVVCISVRDTSCFNTVRADVERLGIVKSWFNVDLYHFQRYLYTKTFAPTDKVEVEWDVQGRLAKVTVLDDFSEVTPPPFSALRFEVAVRTGKLAQDVRRDPVCKMFLRGDEGEVETLEGGEANVLEAFVCRVGESDPDFLVASRAEETLNYVFERARLLGLSFQLGRELVEFCTLKPASTIRGRAVVDLSDFREYGVAGLCELSRFTLAPPSFSAKWPAGKTIDARQAYEALRKDILVPVKRGFPRFAMTAREIHEKDKGGLLFSPTVGLHANAAELDFESMFPNIILRRNISYETTSPRGIDLSRPGFLGEVVKTVLDRRLRFKHLRRKFPLESAEYKYCDQRQKALKSVLVCIYGFSGCFANRFNNVAVFNEINAVARKTLVRTANICQEKGFEVIYGNTDSIFVKRSDATRRDYEELAHTIEDATGLPIALDNHYQFIVFMPRRSGHGSEAMNRFFGKLVDGGFHCRGIDVRRCDCPNFLKVFQNRLMEVLFDAEDCADVLERGVSEAEAFTQQTYRRVVEGRVDPFELKITKHVYKDIETYRSMFPHVVAARHLDWHGGRLGDYGSVDFLYVNAGHSNPMRRTLPTVLLDKERSYYDRVKYGELVKEVARTILGPLRKRAKVSLTLDSF